MTLYPIFRFQFVCNDSKVVYLHRPEMWTNNLLKYMSRLLRIKGLALLNNFIATQQFAPPFSHDKNCSFRRAL